MPKDAHTITAIRASFQHFSYRLWGVKVSRAAEILDALGHGEEHWWWVYRDRKKFSWTANKLSQTGLSGWPARSIDNIKFIGGPVGKRKLHHGTFLTLLIDRILRTVEDKGLAGLQGAVGIEESYA